MKTTDIIILKSSSKTTRSEKYHISVYLQPGNLCGLSNGYTTAHFTAEVLEALREDYPSWKINHGNKYCKTCVKVLEANI